MVEGVEGGDGEALGRASVCGAAGCRWMFLRGPLVPGLLLRPSTQDGHFLHIDVDVRVAVCHMSLNDVSS